MRRIATTSFQMHFHTQIDSLDDHRYSPVQAPLFFCAFYAAPAPHALLPKRRSDGHVLTVPRRAGLPLLESAYPGTREAFGPPGNPACRWRINPTSWRRSNITGSYLSGVHGTTGYGSLRTYLAALAQAVF